MTSATGTICCRVVIRGRVQGVGYRAWTDETAREFGLEGWVRNCRDGSVEAVFAGNSEVVAQMVEACRQGPYGARVTAIEQRMAGAADLGLRGAPSGFSVLTTA